MKQGKVVLGVLAGLAAGAVLGILLAPDKGENTRKRIVSKGEGYIDDVKEKFSGVLNTINKKYDSLRHGTEELIISEKEKYNEIKEKANNGNV